VGEFSADISLAIFLVCGFSKAVAAALFCIIIRHQELNGSPFVAVVPFFKSFAQ
jgi:hypothetical protein